MMRFITSFIATTALLTTTFSMNVSFVAAKEEGHHKKCACEAAEWNFNIDCTDREAMNAALSALLENDCATKCDSDTCVKNYFIIQSHHDYCLHAELPEGVEDGIHIYEGTCEDCEITKKYDPELGPCPAASCNDNSGNESYQALLAGGCDQVCETSTCASSFRTLKAVHDTCDEDVLATAAEQNYHDFEEACEAFHCNIALSSASDADALICESSAPTHVNSMMLAVTTAVVGMLFHYVTI